MRPSLSTLLVAAAAGIVASTTLMAQADTSVRLSEEAYDTFVSWLEGPETNPSLQEAVVDGERIDLIQDWLFQVGAGTGEQQLFSEYLSISAPQSLARWQEELSELSLNPSDEATLAAYVLAMDSDRFEAYESAIILAGMPSLESMVRDWDPVFYQQWDLSREVPARSTTLVDYIYSQGELITEDVLCELLHSRLIGWYDPRCPGEPYEPPESACVCTIVWTISGTPSQFLDQDQVLQDEKKKKKKWWSEQWRAAHYMEAYVYGKGKKMNIDQSTLQRVNETEIRARIHCVEDGQECGHECRGIVHVYEDYHTRVQVNTNTWSIWGGKSEAAASDHVVVTLDANSGRHQLLDKAVAMKQTSETKFKLDKAVELADSIIKLGGAVFGKGDPTQIPKLTAESVKHFQGVVEVTGKKGTNSEDMRAHFDSISTTDPNYPVFAHDPLVLMATSDGRIAYEGEGRNETENSYYGSSNATGMVLNDFVCPADVVPPQPIAIWSHTSTFRSPFHGTTNDEDNLRTFIQFLMPGTGTPDTSPNNSHWPR